MVFSRRSILECELLPCTRCLSVLYRSWHLQREDVPPTVDGMLGGLAQVAPADEKESLQLLKRLKSSRPEMSWKRAADLGGGIGRVTKNVLAKHFSSVDLIEQNSSLTDMAQTEFLADCPQLGSVAAVGLQSWLPEKSTYDCVWMQWVAGYVLDPHFIALLRRISACLAPGGVLVVKENVTHPATCALWMDHADASTIRSRQYFQELFALGGLRVIRVTQQREWPADLYPIQVWVLEADGAQDATPP